MRKVFFSFHYNRDVMRVAQVRNSWIVRGSREAQPFLDKADWEKIKIRKDLVEKWIEQQLKGTSVTVILFGKETYDRPWVRHEIKRSYMLKKGIISIDIHGIKDPKVGADTPGRNPLDYWSVNEVPLSRMYKSYNWISDSGYKNISSWIEDAAVAAGR